MNRIKIVLIVSVLFFTNQFVSAQDYKFQTTTYSVLEKTKSGSWGKWSEPEKANIIITLDTKKNRIVVYSQEVQLYNIVDYDEKIENDKNLIYGFQCEDIDKKPFSISIVTRKNQGNRKQLYINQSKVIVLYNIENFKEKSK